MEKPSRSEHEIRRTRKEAESGGKSHGGFAREHVYSRNRAASGSYVEAYVVQPLLTRGRLATEFKSAFKTFLH